jgi:hypothetical protein
MQKFLVLPFIAMTFLSWGLYGPVLHQGQHNMGDGVQPSSLRPLICVGMSYFLIAVVVPLAMLWTKGEKGKWTISGAFWSFAAGTAGAIGALGIILAFKFRGSPLFVMPLVFGLAPVMNTFVTMWMTKSFKQVNVVFLTGVITVAVGASGGMFFKPVAKHAAPEPTVAETHTADDAATPETAEAEANQTLVGLAGVVMVPLSIALTAICWGSYGPVLHKGQMKMEGSRMRPFLCVGLAYFVVAVLAPLPLLEVFHEPGGWSPSGVIWSLAGGAVGAIGALGIVLAFNFGGKPIYVMPLVFGGAPVVNTLTTTLAQGTIGQISILFYLSLALVITGAVTVLVFAPRLGKASAKEKTDKKPKEKPAKKPEPVENKPADVTSEQTPVPVSPPTSVARDQDRPADSAKLPSAGANDCYNPALDDTFDSEDTIEQDEI